MVAKTSTAKKFWPKLSRTKYRINNRKRSYFNDFNWWQKEKRTTFHIPGTKFQKAEASAGRGQLCLEGSVFYCNSVMSPGVTTVSSKTIKINKAMTCLESVPASLYSKA